MTAISGQPTRRVALVTGAARGIGAGIAKRLARDGHDVAVLDLDAADCADTVAMVRSFGVRGFAVAANVADESAVQIAVDSVRQQLGPPTILVNNAGILRDRSLAKMSVDEWDLVLSVNLRGAFLMCRAVQTDMRQSGWGRIINLSSTAALGAFGEANYSAAKAGVQGLTKTLAIELGRYGITANAIAPGFVETEMTRAVADTMGMVFDDMIQAEIAKTVVGRIGQPDDIANAASFFASPDSSYVTGQVLYVAGGPRG